MRWFIKLSISLILVIGVMVAFTPYHAMSANVKRGGTITVGIDTAPLGWDPHLATAKASGDHYEQVYEGLVQLSNKDEIVPWLATSWKFSDPKTLIFTLRKGVKFHNGREMVADDVKYSYDRIRKDCPQSGYYDAVKSIEVLDQYTVKFNFSVPDATLLSYMASGRYRGIVPKEEVEKHGDLKSAWCGTGPFMVKEYVPGDYTVFERNPNYWQEGLPLVDSLIFKVIKDENSRLAALRRGSVDVGWVKVAELASLARKHKGLQVVVPPSARYMWVWLHYGKFPFNNKKLRQAVSCAIDREAMVKSILLGFGDISASLPPAAAPYALLREEVANLPFYKRDLKKSKRLMKEAGYPNGFEFTILTSTHGPGYVPTAELIQSFCKDVGIKVNIEVVEWGIQLNRWKAGDFQCDIQGSIWEADPDHYIRNRWSCNAKANYIDHCNPELDKLLDESRETVDVKKRIEIWKKIQYLMAEDVSCIFAQVGPTRFEVSQDYVKDYYFLPSTSRIYLRQAWLDK